MRNINTILANDDWTLDIAFDDGAARRFDVKHSNYDAEEQRDSWHEILLYSKR